MKSNLRISVLMSASVSLVALSAATANAQVVDEIIVTAQKRAQNLQQVPLSVSAVSGEKISESGADNLEDLSSLVPGVIISKGPVNTNIYIRGIGSGLNRGFEQSVGMYIDGIYNGRGRQYRSPFLDIERVEILRGPQGILFGKNTIAGAISVTSKEPKIGEDYNGFAEVTYEPEYENIEVKGAFGGSLGENLAGRVAAKYRQSDGYVENLTAGRNEPSVDEISLRGTLVWEPSDTLDITAKVGFSNYDVDGSNGIARVFKIIDDPAAALDTIAFAAVPLADSSFAGGVEGFQAWRNVGGPTGSVNPAFPQFGFNPDQNNTENLNGVLTANWDVGGGVITSVTGWSQYETDDGADVDFLPIQFIHRDDFHDFDQLSQEIRYTSPETDKFSYILGAYYDKQNLDVDGSIWIDGTFGGLATPLTGGLASTFLGPVSGVPVSYNVILRTGSFIQESETIAIFGEVTFDITDTVKLTGGARYSNDKKNADKSLFISSDTTGGPLVAANPDDGGAGTVLTATWNGLFGTLPHDVSGEREENHFLPSVKLQWQASEDVMAYASYSEGFKSGGFNAADDLAFTGTTGLFFPQTSPSFGLFNAGTPLGFEYEDEVAKSYELGFKSELFDRRARLNANVFFTEYDNLQVSSFQGTNFVVGNAANAEIKGLEVEGELNLSESFKIGGSAAYLDFEYIDYDTAGCTAVQAATINQAFAAAGGAAGGGLSAGPYSSGLCSTGSAITLGANGFPVVNQNLTGQTSEYSPEFSGNIFASYDHQLSDSYAVRINADVNFSDEFFLDSDLDVDSIQDSYSRLNLRLALRNEDQNWELAIFGRNITDEAVFASSNDTPLVTGSHTAFIQEPRVWGASARIDF